MNTNNELDNGLDRCLSHDKITNDGVKPIYDGIQYVSGCKMPSQAKRRGVGASRNKYMKGNAIKEEKEIGRLIGKTHDIIVYVSYRRGDKFYVTDGSGGNNISIQRDEYGDWRTKSGRKVVFAGETNRAIALLHNCK